MPGVNSMIWMDALDELLELHKCLGSTLWFGKMPATDSSIWMPTTDVQNYCLYRMPTSDKATMWVSRDVALPLLDKIASKVPCNHVTMIKLLVDYFTCYFPTWIVCLLLIWFRLFRRRDFQQDVISFSNTKISNLVSNSNLIPCCCCLDFF